MPNTSLSKLVVIGPREDVRRFVKAAEPLPDNPGEADPSAPLSYGRLRPLGEKEDPVDVYGTKWLEPDQVSRSRIRKRGDEYAIEYQFVSAWGAPCSMMQEVSEDYPTLEFVLAEVGASDNSVGSWFMHRGHSDGWGMPDEDRERLYMRIVRKHGAKDIDDLDDDTGFEVDMEFDQKGVDIATAYWTADRRRALRATWRRPSRRKKAKAGKKAVRRARRR
jgi:hypothetical protein